MRLAAAVLLLPALVSPALAADSSEREILGFSADGNYFAFEEYGIQDGSGFPYSNIFIIETATDTWLPGTPIRVRTDSDTAALADTRFDAREKAQPLLTSYAISAPADLVVSNPLTELSADPHLVRFEPRLIYPRMGEEWTASLEELPFPARNCPTDSTYNGFRLTLTGPDGQARILNDDRSIPDSRNCPFNYAISDVLTYYPETGEPALVIMISVFSYGFEGPDRRFLAVVTRL